jgi:hypothetical protein
MLSLVAVNLQSRDYIEDSRRPRNAYCHRASHITKPADQTLT